MSLRERSSHGTSGFIDGNGPGCVCGNDCEMPCWQRVGMTSQPCCAGCAALPTVEGEPVEDPEAQNIIDAMRFALMAQDDDAQALRVVKALLEMAPDSLDDAGAKIIVDLICEGTLTVALVNA